LNDGDPADLAMHNRHATIDMIANGEQDLQSLGNIRFRLCALQIPAGQHRFNSHYAKHRPQQVLGLLLGQF
jgi:hypothetical protein